MEKEGIGKEFTGVSICFFCHDGQGNFLVAKRSKGARDEHETWECAGGGLKFGERAEDALRREVSEEFCTDVLGFEFLGYRDILRIQNDIPTHWIGLDFLVQIDHAKVAIGEPHKCDEIRWVKLNQIPEPVHSQFPVFLEKYRERFEQI